MDLKTFEYNDYHELFRDLNYRYLTQEPGLIDFWKAHMAKTQNVVIEVAKPTSNLDLAHSGYKSGRYTKFGHDYMDQKFWPWLDKISPRINRSEESGYLFKDNGRHVHGNCCQAMSFSIAPVPTITLMSRSVFLLPTGPLELSLVGQIADQYMELYGEQIKLNWMIAQMQYTPLWAFPYIIAHWDELHDSLLITPEFRESKMGVNFWRTYNNYIKFNTTDWRPAYNRAARLYTRSWEVAQGTDVRIPTEWPLKRLQPALELGIVEVK